MARDANGIVPTSRRSHAADAAAEAPAEQNGHVPAKENGHASAPAAAQSPADMAERAASPLTADGAIGPAMVEPVDTSKPHIRILSKGGAHVAPDLYPWPLSVMVGKRTPASPACL